MEKGGLIMKKLSMVLAVVAVVLMSLPALAAERERPDNERPNVQRGNRGDRNARRGGGMRERMLRNVPAEMRELIQKRRDGKELTKEETAKLDEFRQQMRERFRQARGARGAAQRGPTNPLVREKLNPADTALQTMAEVMLKAQQFEKAIKALERMTKSPDAKVQASAHFNIATIYRRHLGDTDKAIAEYRKVEGPLALRAWNEIVSLADEMGEIEKGVAILEEILSATMDKVDKLKLLHIIAKAWGTHEQPDKAVEALERIVKLLPYDEAAKMTDLFFPTQAEVRKLSNTERIELQERLQFLYRPYDDGVGGRRVRGMRRP